jgi:hypothetical protein
MFAGPVASDQYLLHSPNHQANRFIPGDEPVYQTMLHHITGGHNCDIHVTFLFLELMLVEQKNQTTYQYNHLTYILIIKFLSGTYYMELVIDKLMYKAFVEATDRRKLKRE